MANSAQLSVNNANGGIQKNNKVNSEHSFRWCIDDVFTSLEELYPEYCFVHTKHLRSQDVYNSYTQYSRTHTGIINAPTDKGGAKPDGGIIKVRCKDNSWLPVFIGENKFQNNNPGNAIERSLKNITFFKNYLINENYFPYLININGPIVCPEKMALLDRISQDGGFMEINKVHVLSDSAFPRIRPFTILTSCEFDYEAVSNSTLEIINISIEHLKNDNRL